MIKKYVFLIFAIGILIASFGQNIQNTCSQNGQEEIQIIKATKGQTLIDLMPAEFWSKTQTDINPGIDPEGDFILRSTFSTDGTKVFVVNGGTDNVTVFDFETMTPIAVIEGLVGYPVDIAVTNDYAIVGCLGSIIYVVDLDDYSIVGTFPFTGNGQAVVVETSPDGNFAYVAFDVTDQLAKIDLVSMEIENTFDNFPVQLLSYSWVSTGGRSSFKFTRFGVSPDGAYLIVGNGVDEVLFIDTMTGEAAYSVSGIPDCNTINLSGDGTKTIALSFSYTTNILNVYQIDNTSHNITGTVEVTGYFLSTNEVGVNADGSKAYIGISNNSSAIVKFATSNFTVFTQTYTAFWIGTSPDHNYAVSGQFRFSIIDFENEVIADYNWGNSQDFGCISPVEFKVVGYDPLRYEGLYFYDCSDPENIELKGKELSGYPPEGDTPYRIAISQDGTKAVTSNSLSANMSIINLATYSVDTIIGLGENCDAIGITHDSQWAIMGGYDLNTIKIIDLSTNEFVTSVLTGQRPMMVAIAPDDAMAYIGNLKQNSVSFVELDGVNSGEVADIPIGVIGLSWAAFGVRSSVEVDPSGQYVLVAASFEDQVQVIDIEQQQIVAEIPIGTFPLKIAFNDTGEYAAVTNYNSSSFSIIHVDGVNSSLVGTYSSNGNYPMRLAYNPFNDEFGIVVYDTKKVINVNAQTGVINSTDNYSQYGSPIMIMYDVEGKPLVLTIGSGDVPGYLVRENEAVELPATPTYFDYCAQTHTAVVNMPGPDYVSVIEYDLATDPPVADFGANITTIQVGGNVEFSDLSQNNPTSWSWSFEGGTPTTSDEQNPTIIYNDPGVFDVSLTVTNPFGSDTKTEDNFISVDTLTFIDHDGVSLKLSVYPNPVSDKLFITFNEKIQKGVFVSIFSLEGRMLISKNLTEQINEIEMKEQKAGLYILKVFDGNEVKTIKINKTY